MCDFSKPNILVIQSNTDKLYIDFNTAVESFTVIKTLCSEKGKFSEISVPFEYNYRVKVRFFDSEESNKLLRNSKYFREQEGSHGYG